MVRPDEVEFEALLHRRSRFVFRVAYSVLRNSHDAEDIVQEVFLKLYRNSAWREARDEQAFLARVTWRMAVDRLSKTTATIESDDELASKVPDPEQAVIDSDWQSKIHRLIDSLPEELRQPLALSTIEELTSSEIARVVGVPEGTVRTRVLRARQLLREKIAALESKGYAAKRS
ncbi:MAG TPA: RNA polymerase sigma factor [Pseudacidobacterium sp.]|nr:RNA polymerase sigma factor [Pseudacidobacterium sp.]